jgi:hypothetical protein
MIPAPSVYRETQMAASPRAPLPLRARLALLLPYTGLSERQLVQAAKLSRKIDVEAFVLAWVEGASLAELQRRFDLADIAYVSAVAKRLRLAPRNRFGRDA